MFSALARRYDLANDVISLGLHRLARRRLTQLVLKQLRDGSPVLDIACGTGDLSLRIARAARRRGLTDIAIEGLDFSEEMLELAREKAQREGLGGLRFSRGDAQQLPFADASFDSVVMGFGIRNFDAPLGAMGEIARVLRHGGFVCILEAGAPQDSLRRAVYSSMGGWALPMLGGLITGRPKDYAYLHRTSLEFPSGDAFLDYFRACGNSFGEFGCEAHAFGALYIYSATRSGG